MRLARLRGALAGHPHRVDVVLAAAFCAVSLVQVLLNPIASRPVSVLVAVGSTLPLAWRRRRPVGAALAGSAVWLIPTGDGFLYLGYVIAVLLFFSVGANVPSLRVTIGVTTVGAIFGVVATLRGPEPPPAALGSILAVAAPAAVGRLVGHQRAQAERLEDLAERLRRERAGAERAAVAEERSRIARELHDVVGHEVSVIALQADAAAAALETAPALARAPVSAIRESAGEALAEMRRVLGALREDEDEAGPRPQPGLADLPALAERARAAGTPVELVVDGAPRHAPPSVELAAYRLAQEALTNARKHAPGAPVRIEVIWDNGSVALRVADAGPGTARAPVTGYGLVGMRERVRLVGGELHTGPAPGGGFEVAATLPVDATVPE